LADIYAKLDEQQALGIGRIGARSRPVASPKAQTTESEDDGRYVAQTRSEFRREQDRRFESASEAIKAAERKRNESFFADIRTQCGSGPLTGAQLGMSQEVFEACGQEIRFGGGLTHVISLRVRGQDARLYVFAQGVVHKVYAVDRRITRIEPYPLYVAKVTLPPVGRYPPLVTYPQMLTLSQGNLFSYGQTHVEDWKKPAGAEFLLWADKAQRSNGSTQQPFMWDAHRQGWVKFPKPPTCAGYWHQHTLTALADDRVLVAGGMCDIPRLGNEEWTFEPQFSTALWDARQLIWLEAPNLKQPRIYHTASALNGEQVMLVGGLDDPLTVAESTLQNSQQKDPNPLSEKVVRVLDSVELLTNGKWHSLPPLRTARAKHTATTLPDGRVLVAGGVGQRLQAFAKVELWDPVQQAWLPRAAMRTSRYGHTATLLFDGRVLVSGGVNEQEALLNTTELYDPTSDTWSDGPPMPDHLQGHSALSLPDGRVLLAGGRVSPSAEGTWLISWHPSAAVWQAEGGIEGDDAGGGRHRPSLVQATPGKVLAFGARTVFLYRLPAVAQANELRPDQASQRPADVDTTLPDFPSAWWKEPPPAPVATPVQPPQPVGQPGRLALLGQDLWAARAKLGWLAAGLLGLGLVGSWWRQRRQPAFTDAVSLQGQSVPPRSFWKGWGVRVLVYGILLVVVVLPNLSAYWRLRTADVEDGCRLRPTACLDPSTGLLAKQSAVPERSGLATPRIPCPFVGGWVTRRGNSEFRVDLHADGRYLMHGSSVSDDEGHWAVQGKYMLWRSTKHQVAEMDINRIISNDGQHFELIEANGLHSHFDRQADLPTDKCEP
jgi:hypothetical protein